MRSYLLALTLGLSIAPSAGASLHEVFGLSEFSIMPPSGVATSIDPIHIEMEGVAGSSLVPMSWNLSPSGPNELTINLVNPYDVGLTVLTPWSFGVELPALAAGHYDFYLRAEIGSPPYHISDRQLLAADFLVQPARRGDFDGNGVVDEGDYQWWRDHYVDGAMGAADYVVWRNSVGSGGSAAGSSTATPEPSAALMLVVAGCAALCCRRR